MNHNWAYKGHFTKEEELIKKYNFYACEIQNTYEIFLFSVYYDKNKKHIKV